MSRPFLTGRKQTNKKPSLSPSLLVKRTGIFLCSGRDALSPALTTLEGHWSGGGQSDTQVKLHNTDIKSKELLLDSSLGLEYGYPDIYIKDSLTKTRRNRR